MFQEISSVPKIAIRKRTAKLAEHEENDRQAFVKSMYNAWQVLFHRLASMEYITPGPDYKKENGEFWRNEAGGEWLRSVAVKLETKHNNDWLFVSYAGANWAVSLDNYKIYLVAKCPVCGELFPAIRVYDENSVEWFFDPTNNVKHGSACPKYIKPDPTEPKVNEPRNVDMTSNLHQLNKLLYYIATEGLPTYRID